MPPRIQEMDYEALEDLGLQSIKFKLKGHKSRDLGLQSVKLKLIGKDGTNLRRTGRISKPVLSKLTIERSELTPDQFTDYEEYEEPTFLQLLETYKTENSRTLSKNRKKTLESAIEYIKSKTKLSDIEQSKMAKKVAYLMRPEKFTERERFLLAIFTNNDGSALQHHIRNHIRCLKEMALLQSITPSNYKATYGAHYNTKCRPLQTMILGLLDPQLQEAYKQFTTPLFFALEESGSLETERCDLLKEFFDQVEIDPTAICYVFSDNLFNVMSIHLGVWRQLFNDGHKLVKADPDRITHKSIETCGVKNATSDETILPKSGDNFLCPCCMRIIGKEDRKGKFTRSGGLRTSVDHTNPVGCAWINYDDDALCEQLVVICFDCNAHKSDTSLIEFFNKIMTNHNHFYDFDSTTPTLLSPKERIDRVSFYIKNIRNALRQGVNTFPNMLIKAEGLKTTYTEIEKTKDEMIKVSKGIIEYVETVPTLFQHHRSERVSTDAGFIAEISTLFLTLIGSYMLVLQCNEYDAIEYLFNIIKVQSQSTEGSDTISRNALITFFQAISNNTIVPIDKRNYYFTFSDMLATKFINHLGVVAIGREMFHIFCDAILEDSKSKAEATRSSCRVVGSSSMDTGTGKTKKKKDNKKKRNKYTKRR